MTIASLHTNATASRDRLLQSAAQLLDAHDGRVPSTRQICARAGVQAPTLYHHFGNKQGLIDAVVSHGFTQYVARNGASPSADPVADLREGWDAHVAFGLDHPRFYALLYGAVVPGRECGVTAPAKAMLREILAVIARNGQLRVPVDAAADQILAANVGVTLSLIAQPDDGRSRALSADVREALLASVLVDAPAPPAGDARAAAAIALSAVLETDADGLSPGEAALLRELLARLATA
jgi:AcrR family transcriptional regulator